MLLYTETWGRGVVRMHKLCETQAEDTTNARA